MNELALHIMDIMQNSITASSKKISVSIHAAEPEGKMYIIVEDDGCGMNQETLKRALDPQYISREARLAGMGLPRFREAAVMTGGDLMLESELGKGTRLEAVFMINSLKRAPMGNLGNVFFLTMLSYEKLELKLELKSRRGTYIFESDPFRKSILEQGRTSMDAAFHAETLINYQVDAIFKKVLPEIIG